MPADINTFRWKEHSIPASQIHIPLKIPPHPPPPPPPPPTPPPPPPTPQRRLRNGGHFVQEEMCKLGLGTAILVRMKPNVITCIEAYTLWSTF